MGFKIVWLKIVDPRGGLYLPALQSSTSSLDTLSYLKLGPLGPVHFNFGWVCDGLCYEFGSVQDKTTFILLEHAFHFLSSLRVGRLLVQVSGSFAGSTW